MYKIGDNIVYPMHGAGTIESIETREILGTLKDYYVLTISSGNMSLMIPVDSCEKIGVRLIVSSEELRAAFFILGQTSSSMSENWNKRQKENTEKLKTGDICKVAEVVRNLTRVNRVKKLSTGEKKMLSNAMRILVSEVMLVDGIEENQAMQMIEDAI